MKSKLIIAGSAMCIAVVLSSLVKRAREGACEMSCRNTFKTISLALQNYNDAYGTLPPAVTLGADGHAKHSWRALILNYVTAMPSIYDNDQAWDGEKNVRLVNGHVFHFDRPAENTKGIGPYDGPLDFATWFRCCAHQSKIDYSANVVAVTGTQTLWPKIETRGLGNIPDGAENTILLVETRNYDLYWSEPKDLAFDEMSFEINSVSAPSISSNHRTGPIAVFADGAAYRLSPAMPPDIVRALLTYDGGERYTVQSLICDGLIFPDR